MVSSGPCLWFLVCTCVYVCVSLYGGSMLYFGHGLGFFWIFFFFFSGVWVNYVWLVFWF